MVVTEEEAVEPERGERVNGTVRTILLIGALLVWGGVHVGGIVGHYGVSSSFDTGFATVVGSIAVFPRKADKKPKD